MRCNVYKSVKYGGLREREKEREMETEAVVVRAKSGMKENPYGVQRDTRILRPKVYCETIEK